MREFYSIVQNLLNKSHCCYLQRITVSLFVVYFISISSSIQAQSGPGPQWAYVRDITLSQGTPLANFQVKVELPSGSYSGMNTTGSDLRFYDAADNNCPYWIEKWDMSGKSIIWVKVTTSGTTALKMYFGNTAAPIASNGDNTFEFFDGFDGTQINSAKWSTSRTSSTNLVTVSGGEVNLKNNGSGEASIYTPTPFNPNATKFIIEVKHRETKYYRNRFYASNKVATSSQNLADTIKTDYGLWGNDGGSDTGKVHPGNQIITAGTDYLMKWQCKDGSNTFSWSNLNYKTLNPISSYTTNQLVSNIRYLHFAVTEATNGSTLIDWVRVRKDGATSYDPTITFGPKISLPPFISTFSPASVCTNTNATITISGYNFIGTTQVKFNGVNASSFTVNNDNSITATSQNGVTSGFISVTSVNGTVTSTNQLIINAIPLIYDLSTANSGKYCSGGSGLELTLSGSQSGVNYFLFKNGVQQSTTAGTGSALVFPNLTTGSYSIQAENATSFCNATMNGNIDISEVNFNNYNVTGGGAFCSGQNGVSVILSKSDAGVTYTLFRDGNIVTSLPGNGAQLTFSNINVTGNYTIEAAAYGCSKTMNGSVSVTENSLPVISLNANENSGSASNDNKICLGDNITFTATNYSDHTYTFTVNGSDLSPSGSNVFATTSLPAGTNAISVKVKNNATTCTNVSTALNIVVNQLPDATITVDKNNVCPGQVKFTASGGTYFTFYINNVDVQHSASATFVRSDLITGDKVKVLVKNANGCEALSNEIMMTFKPTVGQAGAISGSTEFCQGTQNVPFTVGNIANATSYVWSYSGSGATITNNGLKNITINFAANATSGKLSVVGSNECGEGSEYTTPFDITINKLPDATISSDVTTVCEQSSNQPQIKFTGSTGVAPYTFVYKINSGTNQSVSTLSGNSTLVNAPTNVAGTYKYTLISVTDSKGCSKTLNLETTITVSPLPLKPAIPTGAAAVCQGSTANYQVTDVTYADANGYHWSYSGTGATINGNGKNISLVFANNATSGDLTVYAENSCGQGAASDVFHITVNPLPEAYINTSKEQVCQNDPIKPKIIFTGEYGTAPYTFTYNINGGASTSITTVGGNSSISIDAPVNATGTFVYNLLSVKDNSSTKCSNLQNGTVTITIDTLPIPVLEGPDLICPDQTLDYSTQSGDGIHDYSWTITNGTKILGGGLTDPTVRVHWNNNTTAKSIYVNYTDGNGCKGATNVSVTSTSPTTPKFDPSGPKVVCVNSEGNVYTVQTGDGGYTFTDYQWNISGGTITSGGTTNDNSATVKWTSPGNKWISVNFNSGTCAAPAPTVYNVTVNPLPTGLITTNNNSVCTNGTEPQITFTGANGKPGYEFTYTLNGVPSTITSSGNTSAINQSLAVPGIFTYKLQNVKDANGCEQTQSSSFVINVHPVPGATISGSTQVCVGNTKPEVTFTASGGTAPYTFTYKLNGITQPAVTSATSVYKIQQATTVSGSFTYELVSVKDNFSCLSTISGQSATVMVNSLPTATISGPDSVCQNTGTQIIIHGANGTPNYTFNYKINGGTITSIISEGDDATIPISNTSGTYTFTLVSVSDASTNSCSQLQNGSLKVVVSPVTVGGSVAGSKTICTGGSGTVTLSGHTDKIMYWQSSTDGNTWTNISNTTTTLSYTNLTSTTKYRAAVKSGACDLIYSSEATITVNESIGATFNINNTGNKNITVCAGSFVSVVGSGFTGSVVQWETSINNGATWQIVNGENKYYYEISNISQTTWFRLQTQNSPCGKIYSEIAKVNVNQRPTGVISGNAQLCVGGSATVTINLTGSGFIQGKLSDGTVFSGVEGTPVQLTFSPNPPGESYTITSLSDANCSARATDMNGVSNIIVTATPGPVVIRPTSAIICKNGIVPLSSVLSDVTNPAPVEILKTVNQDIPQGEDATPLYSKINVTGLPVGSIIDSIHVTFNVTQDEVFNTIINLAAPNGKSINLVGSVVSGKNFTNTTISSDYTKNPLITSSTAPYTGLFSAQGEGQFGANPANSNTNKFSDLFGSITNPQNGDWTLEVYNPSFFYQGTFNDWKLKIYYHVPDQAVAIIWSPVTGLYTDASATIPYTGGAASTVYAKPEVTTTYTGTSAQPQSCIPPSQVTVTLNPPPVVTISADYCSVPGKVSLTANSTEPSSTFTWSTGETTKTVNVDVAHLYAVSAKTALGCVSNAAMSVAQELVVNGDFEAGNSNFSTGYQYKTGPGVNVPKNDPSKWTLYAAKTYAIDTNAHNYHDYFYGKDHTTPEQKGKFMMINGTNNVLIWKQTVNVLPYTRYYYSGWGMNLTSSSPARLQFSVNDTALGTIAELDLAPKPRSNEQVNINNWKRFYYGQTDGWWSGSNTSVTIKIINLNPAGGGNDFGLDDISFATLAPFITKSGEAGSENQTLCKGDSIVPIIYNVGTGGDGPEVKDLPKGLSADWNGLKLVISGVPDTTGIYDFSITTQGSCPNPITSTGHIVVNGQNIRLSSAPKTDDQVICRNNTIQPITYRVSGQGNFAYATGLPQGMSGTFDAGTNTFTITGAPDTSGVIPFKIFAIGAGCHADSIEGKITVNIQTLKKLSGDDQQVKCINTPLDEIMYEIGGTGNGATVNGLPSGVTGVYQNGQFIISGTPTISGEFPFTVTSTGGCASVALTGKLTITANATSSLISAPGSDEQQFCLGGSIAPIQYKTTGLVTGADFTGLPPGVTGNFTGGTITLNGIPSATGTYHYQINTLGTCTQATAMGTITVDGEVIGGTLNTTYNTDCGGDGVLKVSGESGNVKMWQQSLDNGSTWTDINNSNSDTYNFNVANSTFFRAVIDGNTCDDAYSNAEMVGVHNLWTGSQSDDWQTGINWSDGKTPTISATCPDVVIPQVANGNYYPRLLTGSAGVNNLIIDPNATLVVNGGTLRVQGGITNNGTLDATNGTIEFNGTTNQSISGSVFKNRTINKLIISNNSGLNVSNSAGDTLNITGIIKFGNPNAKLNTGDNITLVSNLDHTASLGAMYPTNILIGKVTVERYIHIGPGAHEKAWLLLATPASGQTIKESWMENGNFASTGYGTQMSGISGSTGFDHISPSPSIKYWNPVINDWVGVMSANAQLYSPNGYFVFVRGDRSIANPNPANKTKLRSKGNLITGNYSFSIPPVNNGFVSLGNPYASAIDLRKLSFPESNPTVYVWNPNTGGIYGYGAYESYTLLDGDFKTVPGGVINNYIQSGQAFFVQTSADANLKVGFTEAAKTDSSENATYFRTGGANGKTNSMVLRSNLYAGSKTTGSVLDGTLQVFNPEYNPEVDRNDARKLFNTGVSLAIAKDGKLLIVERRPELLNTDTIDLRLTGAAANTYTFSFNASNLSQPGLEGWLEDKFLGTKTPVNLDGETNITFTITNSSGSKASDRFRLVFENTRGPLPVDFIKIKAQAKNKTVLVEWEVQQTDGEKYVIERSIDGMTFNPVGEEKATTNEHAVYNWIDDQPESGVSYYRIRMIAKNGNNKVSTTVKVIISPDHPSLSVIPNPIQNGVMNLWMKDLDKGLYQLRMFNPDGKLIMARKIDYSGGNQKEVIKWDYKLAHGTYQLELTAEDGSKRILIVMY